MSILDYRIGLSNKTSKGILDSGFNLDGSEMSPEQKEEYQQFKKDNNMSSIPFSSNNTAMGNLSDAVPLSEQLGITFNNLPLDSPMRTDTRIVAEEYGLEPRDYSESELMESDTTTKEGILSKYSPLKAMGFLADLFAGGSLRQALTKQGAKELFGNFRNSIRNRLGSASYGTSQAAFNAMTPSQQQAVGSIYGQGGIMQGYNPVSAFGRGPAGAIQNRIDAILGRKAAQTAISRQRVKDLQAALDQVGGGGSGDYGPSGYEGMSDAASDQERSEGGRGSRG